MVHPCCIFFSLLLLILLLTTCFFTAEKLKRYVSIVLREFELLTHQLMQLVTSLPSAKISAVCEHVLLRGIEGKLVKEGLEEILKKLGKGLLASLDDRPVSMVRFVVSY